MKFTGTFLSLDKATANNRIYSKDVIKKALSDIQKNVNDGRFMVERSVEFPFDNMSKVNLENVCGVVENLTIADDKLMGDVKLLKLPDEDTMNRLYDGLESGLLSIRPKGTGQLNENGEVSEYKLISLFVTDKPA